MSRSSTVGTVHGGAPCSRSIDSCTAALKPKRTHTLTSCGTTRTVYSECSLTASARAAGSLDKRSKPRSLPL
jgi:hypothetical protein